MLQKQERCCFICTDIFSLHRVLYQKILSESYLLQIKHNVAYETVTEQIKYNFRSFAIPNDKKKKKQNTLESLREILFGITEEKINNQTTLLKKKKKDITKE